MNRAERRRLEKEYRKKKMLPPFEYEKYLQNAMQELKNGNLGQADQIFEKLVASNPKDPNALHFGGITKYQLGSYKKALALLNRAVLIAPEYAEVYNSQGIVLLEQREYEKACLSFERAISLKSEYSNAHANLGNSLKGLGELSKACTSYSTAIKIDPNNREAAYNLAAAHLANNNPTAALEAVEICLGIDPYCQNACAYKAIALLQLKHHEEWASLYNFDELIYKKQINLPNGYDTLKEFNLKLEHDIRTHPTLTWEPLERVTRGGAVTKDISINPSKSITAFKQMLGFAIDEYCNNLMQDSNHPFYARLPKRYRLTLIASILKANGKHPPHIHESSWLSGVYYVLVPSIVNESSDKHEGWLEFGRPDYQVHNDFEPVVTAIKPEEGTMLFFPSYFFHGTIPFKGSEERIGIAFDVYPEE